MFRGVQHLNLDSKGRIAVPAKYRDRLMESCEGNLIITIDPRGTESERCLLIYPVDQWEVFEEKLMSLPNLHESVLSMQRIMSGHVAEQTLDSQGRLTIAPSLRGFAKLTKKTVLMGQGNKFELWDEDTFILAREQWLKQSKSDALLQESLGLGTLSI